MLKEEILKTNFIHADETRIEVIRSKDTSSPKQCYMWVYTTTKWNPKQIRYFDYQNGRGGKFPEKFLKDYEGYIHTDCYGGYDNLIKSSGGKIKRCLCLVHLRRYFYQATDGTTNRTPTNLLAMEGISMLDEVFVFEKKYKDLAPNTRKKLRIENTKPILDKFFEWCQKVVESGFCLEKSKLSQALNYALKGKEEFMTFLEDGNCDISNNPVENAIRPFVIGRKNFLFNFTDNGAKVSAGYYSIIETAKHNGLDPRRYLEWLFNEIPQVRPRNNLEKLREFLPWSEKVPDSCKATAIDNSQDQNESC